MPARLAHIAFFILLWPLSFKAQEPVSLNCVEVSAGGDVTIWWKTPTNTTGFQSYEIYYSSLGVVFTKIDEINNPLTNHYDHIGANANEASRFYYVNVVYTSQQAASDTLQSIFLQVDNNAPFFNDAELFWNAISNPLPQGSSGMYTIYEEYPLGNWFVTASTDALEEFLPIVVCNDSISFRVEMQNSEGCLSVSNIGGAVFKDAIYPLMPVVDSVSINSSGNSVLGWETAVDGDVTGYVIYRFENGIWLEIDRINDRDSTSFVDNDADPCEKVFTYAIASFDSCGNKSPGTFSNPVNTLLIDSIVFDPCDMSATLSWNSYINAIPDLEAYQIYSSTDGINFSLAGTVPRNELTFTQSGLQEETVYTYFVRAVFGNKSSSSCKKSVLTHSYLKPQFIYLANASVLFSNQIELTIDVDTSVNACIWEIWSSNESNPTQTLITAISKTELSSSPIVYTDESADGSLAWYDYYVVVKDSCGKESLISNTLTSMRLSGSQPGNEQNQLDWTAFEGWEEGVDKYYIFRMIGDEIPVLPIDSVGATILTYTDNIAGIENQGGVFAYWVQAKQNPGNPFGYLELSNSNLVYLAEETKMYMPNAFRPNGDNVFMPVFEYFTGSNYLFQIYNRWGQLIFETNNPDKGWTGQHNGTLVPLGVYAYRLVYSNLQNQSFQQQGTLTVVY